MNTEPGSLGSHFIGRTLFSVNNQLMRLRWPTLPLVLHWWHSDSETLHTSTRGALSVSPELLSTNISQMNWKWNEITLGDIYYNKAASCILNKCCFFSLSPALSPSLPHVVSRCKRFVLFGSVCKHFGITLNRILLQNRLIMSVTSTQHVIFTNSNSIWCCQLYKGGDLTLSHFKQQHVPNECKLYSYKSLFLSYLQIKITECVAGEWSQPLII